MTEEVKDHFKLQHLLTPDKNIFIELSQTSTHAFTHYRYGGRRIREDSSYDNILG